jgi:hypothetical protein
MEMTLNILWWIQWKLKSALNARGFGFRKARFAWLKKEKALMKPGMALICGQTTILLAQNGLLGCAQFVSRKWQPFYMALQECK